MPARPRPAVRAALVVLALVAAACTSDPAAQPPDDSATPTAAPTESPAADPIVVDLEPGGDAVTLDNGWTVQHCEGDAPFLCVRDADGQVLGTVEFGSYPVTDDITAALADGDVVPALEERVAEQHETIAADRAQGCGEDYEYEPEPSTRSVVGGEPAVTYGFSGVVDGREIERHRSWYTVHAGQLWVVSAAASDPEGCMAAEFGEFTPSDLATFEHYLERIVAGMELPDAG